MTVAEYIAAAPDPHTRQRRQVLYGGCDPAAIMTATGPVTPRVAQAERTTTQKEDRHDER